MMMIFLQLLSLAALVSSERVVVNRRARQRIRTTPAAPAPAPAPALPIVNDFDSERRFRVQNAFSSLSLAPSEPAISYDNATVLPLTERTYTNIRARAPRRRIDVSRSRESNIGSRSREPESSVSRDLTVSRSRDLVTRTREEVSSVRAVNTRTRIRVPRRRVRPDPNRDLERNERNIASSQFVDTLSNDIISSPVRPSSDISNTRSRSRSRFRGSSRSSVSSDSVSRDSLVTSRSRGRSLSRSVFTDKTELGDSRVKSLRGKSSYSETGKFRPSESVSESRAKPGLSTGPKVIFPRKDLFPKLRLSDNEIDTGNTPSDTANNYNYKANKERLKASLYDKTEESVEISDNIIEDEYDDDYSYTDIQSGLSDSSTGVESGLVTVTHQVPTRTVFTVIEQGETKSLFADVLETSLQLVDLNTLTSTQISSSPVYYSNVETQYPAFGTTEYTYDAILPTPSLSSAQVTVNIGGRVTTLEQTLETTAWRADQVMVTVTPEPVSPAQVSPVSGPGVGQISQIIQNVLLNLIGGGLLGGAGAGPQETQTSLVTHTKVGLTTTTNTDTVLIPVNYRGTEIYQTVTEHMVVTVTTTELSVQTQVNYVPASKPFLPLAPTLHRAVRIVPNDSPVANLGQVFQQQQPPVIQSTRLVTRPVTSVTTVSTDVTTPLTVTLGAREILTEIVEPTTTVITTTTLSTETVLVNNPSSSQPSNNAAALRDYVNRLKLVKSLLGLKL